jgi:SulP family sulfate permease
MFNAHSQYNVRRFNPERIVNSLITGLVIGLLSAITAISFAALVFPGALLEYRLFGIGFLLMGNLVLGATVAVLSSYSGSIAVNQDGPSAILALVVAGILSSMAASATPAQQFFTIMFMVLATTLTTSLVFIILGYFKLGGLARFLPFPVMGGFLAGTGWLLVIGAFGVMTDSPVNLDLMQPSQLVRWLPGLIFAVSLLLVLTRYNHYLVLPGMFFGAIGLFYLVLWISAIPVDQMSTQGWLLGPFPSGGLWQFPLALPNLSHVNWNLILANSGIAAPVLFVSIISVLLNASGIELIVKQDLDLNKELLVAGVGNFFNGLVGGVAGFHTISFTGLNHRLSGGSRLTGLVAALFCGITVFFGAAILTLVPKLVLGGILMFLGLSFIVEWLFQAWFKLPKAEFLVTLLIVAVIAVRGFLEGVVIGILVTVILFVVNYSRIDVVKHMLTGRNFHSRVTRGRRQRLVLEELGESILILQLQGYIFFGTANNLLRRVRERIQQPVSTQVRFVLLDFRQVTGIDSTALRAFMKLLQLAQEKGFLLVLTELHDVIRDRLLREGMLNEATFLQVFNDLDHGLEWCENQLLRDANVTGGDLNLREQLVELLPLSAQVDNLLNYLHLKEVGAGEYLIRQGDPSEQVYIIAAGQVTAQLELPDQEPIRLETMSAGRVVGELGFYLGRPRTASVVADEISKIYVLSRTELQEMETADPEAASAVHRLIIHLLAERVVHLMDTVNALQR